MPWQLFVVSKHQVHLRWQRLQPSRRLSLTYKDLDVMLLYAATYLLCTEALMLTNLLLQMKCIALNLEPVHL